MEMPRREFVKYAGAGLGLLNAACAHAPDSRGGGEGPAEPFSFAVIADPHCAEKESDKLPGCGTGVQRLQACFEKMARLSEEERPDFALIAGDIHPWALLESGQEVWDRTYAVAGNHEFSREAREQLAQVFPNGLTSEEGRSDYYSFVHKGVRFIAVCDAGMGGDHVGHLCSEGIQPSGQCEWLEEQLGAPEEHKVLFAHIPPEREGLDRDMHLSRNDSRWLIKTLERTRPDAAFFGHLHRPTEEYPLGRTRSFNVRSCCWNFDNAPIGYLLVRMTPAGLVVREVETGRGPA